VVVHLAHPLYGEVLRAHTPMLRARRLQRQLADVVEQTGARRADDWLRIATWRLAGGAPVSPNALLAAARRAWVLLDLETAKRMAKAAFHAGAQLPASQILWRVLMLQDRVDEAQQLLAELDQSAANDRERAKLAIARAYLLWGSDRFDAHLLVIEAALATLADPVARAELQALQAVMYAHACQFRNATGVADDLFHHTGITGPVLGHALFSKAMTPTLSEPNCRGYGLFRPGHSRSRTGNRDPWFEPVALLWHCQAQLLGGQLAAPSRPA
jgi:hypothetical protein